MIIKRQKIKQIERSITKMEQYKISKLLNDLTVSKFAKKGGRSGQYPVKKNIRSKTSMLWSDSCKYSDAYIFVKEAKDLLVAAATENDEAQKNVAFKYNAPFISGISKIKSAATDNAEDLDIVIDGV